MCFPNLYKHSEHRIGCELAAHVATVLERYPKNLVKRFTLDAENVLRLNQRMMALAASVEQAETLQQYQALFRCLAVEAHPMSMGKFKPLLVERFEWRPFKNSAV